MRFHKYHALGNDYLVLDPATFSGELSSLQARIICHRNYGVGSDGILLGPLEASGCDFALRFFNPDGGEFEKSGNGLRIFSRYLWDKGLVGAQPFAIMTPGGEVSSQIKEDGRCVTIDMGQISFHSGRIPVSGPPREVLNETIVVDGQEMRFCAATIGNPHCVVLCDSPSPEQAQMWGPLIENDPRFLNRSNVQFLKVLDRSRIKIEIWERGVGYTLASGSSSCAAAAVAHRLDLCDSHITVKMPGGLIDISIAENWSITMTGSVTRICEGVISPEMFSLPHNHPLKDRQAAGSTKNNNEDFR
jgi:diaminopimelate epimerase